jgi:hypothetical protein
MCDAFVWRLLGLCSLSLLDEGGVPAQHQLCAEALKVSVNRNKDLPLMVETSQTR